MPRLLKRSCGLLLEVEFDTIVANAIREVYLPSQSLTNYLQANHKDIDDFYREKDENRN
jgi:hypothetical protein